MWQDDYMTQLIKKLIKPKSSNKDEARREYVLNILLVGSIALSFVAALYSIFMRIWGGTHNTSVPTEVVCFCFLLFCFLLFLSRKGKVRFSSISLLILLSFSATYSSFVWGADVPQILLIYALVTIMGGILINSSVGFFIAVISALYLFILTVLDVYSFYKPMTYWKDINLTLGDTIVTGVTLLIIAQVAWLYNREIEKALKRAYESENALRQERDNLEIIVEERTKALRLAQMEKVAQLERFAEFGRISSGLFHDLAAPLTLVSLNLDRLNKYEKEHDKERLEKSNRLLKRAMIGIKRLEFFVTAARRQVQHQEISEVFSLRGEITKVLYVLTYNAKEKHVTILFDCKKDIHTYGNPIKFSQIITNLVTNAIDAYDDIKNDAKKKTVSIVVKKEKTIAEIIVQDFGIGIIKPHLPLIFKSFFTTKNSDKGMGIGLSICKDIIEKDFKGKITVTSKHHVGTTFTITFPITKKH